MNKFFISPGDPAGIGPEITLKALSNNEDLQNKFVLAGDKAFYQSLINKHNLKVNLIDEGSRDEGINFKHFPLQNTVSIGEPNVANANYIIDILSHGALGCLKKEFKGLITGPINKELINESGFEFSGHTEFLSDISNAKKVVMLLVNKKLKIALLTTHIPLSEVPSKISKKNLEETVSIISEEIKNIWKIENPSICLLGLNPHAGEGGYIGHEDEEILKPFVSASEENVYGPISADTAFIEKNIKKYDVFLAMYHDQGLPVIKSMGFGNTLNVTLGLPFIRISVDHGTAYEIAGKNKADFSSMEEALKTSASLL
mgnify:CR=1 FL=1